MRTWNASLASVGHRFAKNLFAKRRSAKRRIGKTSATLATLLLTAGCALTAVGLVLALVRPWELHGVASLAGWLPLTALGFLWGGAERFASLRTPTWSHGPAMGFVAWCYLGVFVAALAVARPGFGG